MDQRYSQTDGTLDGVNFTGGEPCLERVALG